MRFYGREQEIAFLRETRGTAERVARFTVVTGRRRIGKTTLIKEAYKDEPFVYFFVARKAESDLCEVYLEEVSEKLGIPTLGNSRHFSEIFRYLMQLSQTRSFTLVIDEFQDFFRVNKAVYSEMYANTVKAKKNKIKAALASAAADDYEGLLQIKASTRRRPLC